MISRAGKSTIPQHLCFNNAPGNKKEFNFTKKDPNENEDLSLLLGDNQKNTDLKTEMQKIAENEKKKQTHKRGKGSHAIQTKTSGGFFIPFDMKRHERRERNEARVKSFSFSATSRDNWAKSHASKTNAPEVGKYHPHFDQVESLVQKAVIRAPKKNIGAERKL